MPDQTVSVIQLHTGSNLVETDSDWVVLLTIPISDDDTITTLISKHEDSIKAHEEARKLWRALTDYNQTRRTYFATVSDSQRAAFSPLDRIASVPNSAFNFVNLVFPPQVAR